MIPPTSVAAQHSRFPCHKLKPTQNPYPLRISVKHGMASPIFEAIPVHVNSFAPATRMICPDVPPAQSPLYQTGANGLNRAHGRHKNPLRAENMAYNRNFLPATRQLLKLHRGTYW